MVIAIYKKALFFKKNFCYQDILVEQVKLWVLIFEFLILGLEL